MKDKPDLRVVNSPKQLKKLDGSSNFWKGCPRKLDYLPETSCSLGKPNLESKAGKSEGKCAWWINSEKHNYCFWKYVNEKSTPEGVLPELTHADLAKLFGWSSTKIHFVLKEAVEELTEALEAHGAEDLLDGLASLASSQGSNEQE